MGGEQVRKYSFFCHPNHLRQINACFDSPNFQCAAGSQATSALAMQARPTEINLQE